MDLKSGPTSQSRGIDYTSRMKRILLATTLLSLGMGAPALAADDSDYTIKIIGEDGSVQVIDLRRPEEQAAPPSAPEAAPTAPRAPPPADVSAAPPAVDAAPAMAKKSVKKAATKAAPPPPPPAPPPQAVRPPPKLPVARQGEAGKPPVITRAKAISIALGYAPPSSDVEVYRSDYEGYPVYAVVFKTEDGFHEVLIDDQTGKVLDSRASEAFKPRPARPGHLPVELR